MSTKSFTVSEIESAAAGLRPFVLNTPLIPLLGGGTGAESGGILLKPEIHQAVGSFKLRGVLHAVSSMSEETRARGISTVSAGNTAQALAWCGRHFRVEARSLMPEGAPAAKIEAVRALGGTPVLAPIDEVFGFLREHRWNEEPYAFVHPWTDRYVMLGHSSLGLELAREAPELKTVFIPVGGGGLLGGVGSALRALLPQVRIVAVEPAGCPALHASLAAGAATRVDCKTMCDGVAVPYITEEMFPLLRQLVDSVVLVSEREVRATVRLLATHNHIIAEGAGALATAAALKTPATERGLSVAIVTGGSIDAAVLADILMDEELMPPTPPTRATPAPPDSTGAE